MFENMQFKNEEQATKKWALGAPRVKIVFVYFLQWFAIIWCLKSGISMWHWASSSALPVLGCLQNLWFKFVISDHIFIHHFGLSFDPLWLCIFKLKIDFKIINLGYNIEIPCNTFFMCRKMKLLINFKLRWYYHIWMYECIYMNKIVLHFLAHVIVIGRIKRRVALLNCQILGFRIYGQILVNFFLSFWNFHNFV